MDGKDILALVNAGFTKDEISRMFGTEKPTETEPKHEEQKPETTQETKQEQKPENTMTSLEAKFDRFMEIMTKNNFLGANQPKEETVDDIIANIINPKD